MNFPAEIIVKIYSFLNLHYIVNVRKVDKKNWVLSLDKSLKKKFKNVNLLNILKRANISKLRYLFELDKTLFSKNYNDGENILTRCRLNNDLKSLNILIYIGCDLNLQNYNKKTGLIITAINENFKLFYRLIKNKCNIDTKDNLGNTAFMYSCNNKNTEIMTVLINENCDMYKINNNGDFCTKFYSKYNVNRLIENGFNLNHICENGETVITTLFSERTKNFNYVKMIYNSINLFVRWLIEKKHLFNLQDKHGNTALILACQYANNELIKKLINNGCDVNLQNNEEKTALMIACQYGHCKLVNILIDADCDVNLQNNEGEICMK